jgi:hypothetical protein
LILRRYWLTTIVSVLLAALLCAGPALAQQPSSNTVAKLKDAEGNVLVSQGDAMVAGANDRRLAVGTRVVTTTGAQVTISYDVGCDIRLKENERFTVTVGPCAALLASVESLGPAAGAIGGGTAGTSVAAGTAGALGVGATGAALTAGLITGVGIYQLTRKNAVSPN